MWWMKAHEDSYVVWVIDANRPHDEVIHVIIREDDDFDVTMCGLSEQGRKWIPAYENMKEGELRDYCPDCIGMWNPEK